MTKVLLVEDAPDLAQLIARELQAATYDLAHNDQLEPRVKQALLAQGLTGCISVPLLFQGQLVSLIAEREVNEQTLRSINEKLLAAQQRAEQGSQAKTVFLSNMSHEMRTPLNVLIGYASSMLNQSAIYGGVPLPEIYQKDIR